MDAHMPQICNMLACKLIRPCFHCLDHTLLLRSYLLQFSKLFALLQAIWKSSTSVITNLVQCTRAILRKHRGHYKGASVEWLDLKSRSGGWGLQSLSQIIVAVAYLVGSADPTDQPIVEHQQWMKGMHRHSLLAKAEKAIQELEVGVSLERERADTGSRSQEIGQDYLPSPTTTTTHGCLAGQDDPRSLHDNKQKTHQRFWAGTPRAQAR